MLQHIVLLLMCIFQNLLFQNLSVPPSWQAFWLVSPYIISVNGTLSLTLHLEHCIGISDLPPLWNFQWSSWGRYIQILFALQHYLLVIVINFSVILHCYAWKLTVELFFFFKLTRMRSKLKYILYQLNLAFSLAGYRNLVWSNFWLVHWICFFHCPWPLRPYTLGVMAKEECPWPQQYFSEFWF